MYSCEIGMQQVPISMIQACLTRLYIVQTVEHLVCTYKVGNYTVEIKPDLKCQFTILGEAFNKKNGETWEKVQTGGAGGPTPTPLFPTS